jgi:orotidine-5'-phosphate decarboxylase
MDPHQRIFCALDTADLTRALDVALALRNAVGGFKLGKEFFTANGPEGVMAIENIGLPIFLDLKFHDIPNTVAGAVRSAAQTHCLMTTIHASGGSEMIAAAIKGTLGGTPKILAVTVLTSLNSNNLAEIGVLNPVDEQVLKLAKLALKNGADGIVASPNEIRILRKELGTDFIIMVPGIRPNWAEKNDQKRTMSPADAVKYGADYLVIGRPITNASDPSQAAERIAQEIETCGI